MDDGSIDGDIHYRACKSDPHALICATYSSNPPLTIKSKIGRVFLSDIDSKTRLTLDSVNKLGKSVSACPIPGHTELRQSLAQCKSARHFEEVK